ncbi:glycerate kinase [Kitasatospora indigofera]|uniref:Glycerate kinase n=1 Tax=Kitasatospora indigofera TaxID=67307 RepID=A0A919KN42_9ACTN|nr:glycerate kinase [Kitasatospora indigofera]GHH65992.1 glycerate kinase [Kitasatospora indigofera]
MNRRTALRFLVAPDKFKGSLTAAQAADRLAAGLLAGAPGSVVRVLPVADGGEGTVDAVVAAGFERRTLPVEGPLGDPVQASFALRDGTAVVELAQASGLDRLPGGRPAPLWAATRGTGQLVAAALDAGARTIVLGVGGSASTDGGTGMLTALGARFTDAAGHPLAAGGGALTGLARADLSGLDPRLAATAVVLACDVDNPLLGPDGAAAVYGPQKGASAQQIRQLEQGLRRLVEVLGGQAAAVARRPGAGAAGGTGFAALAGLGAVRRRGIDVLLEATGFGPALAAADLVITGEGSLDAQTLQGKAPAGVAAAARRDGVPVVAVCGRLALDAAGLTALGVARAYPLSALEPDPARSMAGAGPLLERLGARIAEDFGGRTAEDLGPGLPDPGTPGPGGRGPE